MNYWSPKENHSDVGVTAAPDWAVPQRGVVHGSFLALALATVLSFAAGVGSTLFYVQSERGEFAAAVPLIEADKTPTRVRPEGLDVNGKRIATSSTLTSSAMADADMSLPIQGIPEPLELTPPSSQPHVVVELTPRGAPVARPAPMIAEASGVTATPAPSAARYRLQLASMRSADAAANEMNRLNRLFPNELSAMNLAIEKVGQGHRGVYYRVLSTAVDARPAAADLCAVLTAHRAQCMVMATTSAAGHIQNVQTATKQPEKIEKKVTAAAPPPAPVAVASRPAPSASGVRAQLASLRSLEAATRELGRLSRLYPQVLDPAALTVSRVDLGGRGIFYRVMTAPFPDRSTADDLCHRLGSNQAGCVLIAPRSKAA